MAPGMQMVCNGRGRSGEQHGGWKKAEPVPLAIHLPPNKGLQATAHSVRSCLAPAIHRA
jgi:hypothetical protein